MKKLEVGDYVKNLTEKQWNTIMELQPKMFTKYRYSITNANTFGFRLSDGGKFIDITPLQSKRNTNLLTYRQFLGRAKMTFNVARMTQK